jgi:hypothetical protein
MTEFDVAEYLPPPNACDACGRDCVILTTNQTAYGERAVVDPDRRIYFCRYCKASVGLHDGTNHPLGFMADGATRALRARAHSEFDRMWKHGPLSRRAAYELVVVELSIPRERCHFAMMAKDVLLRVIAFVRQYQSEEAEISRRREAKKNERKRERAARNAALESRMRKESRRQRANRWYDR